MHRIDTDGATIDNMYQDGGPGVGATVIDAASKNAIQEEIIGPIEHVGITLQKGTNDQLLKALCNAVYWNKPWDDTGTANNYVITPSGEYAITAYADGQLFYVRPSNANTSGVCYLNVNSLGQKTIKTLANENPTAGEIGGPTGMGVCLLMYHSTDDVFYLLNSTPQEVVDARGTENTVDDRFDTIETEITAARGSQASIDDRLDVALENTGEIKDEKLFKAGFAAHVSISGTTPTLQNRYNVATCTYQGLGHFRITFTSAMSDTNYMAFVQVEQSGTMPPYHMFATITDKATGQLDIRFIEGQGSHVSYNPPGFSVMGYKDA